jgi:hypothetical protein
MYRNKIIIICEGETEENSVKSFLAPYLRRVNPSIGLKPIRSKCLMAKVRAYTNDAFDKSAKAVFTLFDIYEFPCQNFRQTDDVHSRVVKAKEYIMQQTRINHQSFYPHFAVHETEAWFFSDNHAMQKFLKSSSNFERPEPEALNFQNHPSKRINDLSNRYRKTRYDKNFDSRQIFGYLNFDAVFSRCPYFKAFCDDLISVANS